MTAIRPRELIDFWRDAGHDRWFQPDESFDEEIRRRYGELHHAAARGELDAWRETAEGSLALLLLLDQFPRNLFRNSPHAYAADPLALRLAEQSYEQGFDGQVEPVLRPFFLLPFEHSERLEDHDRAVALAERLKADIGDGETLDWAVKHREVIRRFGRFPHRNRALARDTTPEEQAYLDAGGGF